MPEIITCEDVTDEVVAAYAKQGYTLTFAEDVMRYDLSDPSRPLPHADLPFAVTYLEWRPERAHDFFTVYDASFRERPGFPGSSEAEWVQWTAGDPTFRPDLSKLAVIPGHAVEGRRGTLRPRASGPCGPSTPSASPKQPDTGRVPRVGTVRNDLT